MTEVEANKQAWGLLSKDHYAYYRERLLAGTHALNPIILRELGDIGGKDVLHLQCNTGADTVLLARMAESLTGVDFVPENVRYAAQLARDCGQDNVRFVESDIMTLAGKIDRLFDVVFTSEGVIGWLPDLTRWARTIAAHLKPGGFFYVFDSHPCILTLDEDALQHGDLKIKYPYFKKTPDPEDHIGGYAGAPKEGRNYFWMYTIGDVINVLSAAGLRIDFLHEYDRLFFDMGGMRQDEDGLWVYDSLTSEFPLSFSLKAVKMRCLLPDDFCC